MYKKRLALTLVLCTALLSACGNSISSNKASDQSSKSISHNDSSRNSAKQSKRDSNPNSANNNKNVSSKPKNQLDLGIGDTGVIKSNISKYKMTLKSIQIKKGAIGGEPPQADQYILADISIQNIGNKKIEAANISKSLYLDGSYDLSNILKGVKALNGKIMPGKNFNATAVFDVSKDSKYQLIDGLGLADQGAGLQNKVIWTFNASQAK